jgi:HEAT repeat protein
MRYWIMSFAAAVILISAADSQETKKKDLGKKKDPDASQSSEMTEFQGRSFKEWQNDIKKDKDPSKREFAIKSVLQFGPDKAYEAVSDIIVELKKHNNPKPVDLSVRVSGTMVLSTIFKYKKDPDPKYLKEAVAIYKTFLKDEQMMMRIRAVQGLVYLGPTSRDAIPEVITMAKEPATWEARKEAIQILGMIGYEDKGGPKVYVMAEVFKALNDNSFQVRIAAIKSTAALAMKAEPMAPVKNQARLKFLAAIEGDPDKHVVLAAHLAYMTLEGKVTPAHLNPMLKILKDDNAEVRLDALQNIGMLGKDAKGAIPKVIESISDPEVTVAASAIAVLANIDAENSHALFVRINNSKTHPEAVRAAAGNALAIQEMMAKNKKKAEK